MKAPGAKIQATRRYERSHLAAGLCRACPRKRVDSNYLCPDCSATHARAAAAYQQRKKAGGNCIKCGRQRGESSQFCDKCLKRTNKAAMLRNRRRREEAAAREGRPFRLDLSRRTGTRT